MNVFLSPRIDNYKVIFKRHGAKVSNIRFLILTSPGGGQNCAKGSLVAYDMISRKYLGVPLSYQYGSAWRGSLARGLARSRGTE